VQLLGKVTLLSAVIALATGACNATFSRAYTRDELQARLQKRFPVEKQKAVFSIRLSDPALSFPGGDRVAVAVNVEASTLGVPVGRGRATLEAAPYYRPEDGGIYLRDPVLRDLALDGAKPERLEKARQIVSPAVVRALEERPIYTLEPARSAKEARAREHLRRLWIENDRLMIEFTL
jgi:hypothetical protein